MKYTKGILWAILLVTFGIGFTEEWLWGPNQNIRFTLWVVHYGTMPFLYLVYLIQGILRNRSDRMGLIRFLVVYHVRNVLLFIVGWIVISFSIVLAVLYLEAEINRAQHVNEETSAKTVRANIKESVREQWM